MSRNGVSSTILLGPPVSLETHPLRGLSGKSDFSSTPDLAMKEASNGSSDSLNIEHESQRHHRSHEDVRKESNRSRATSSSVHPSTNGHRQTIPPSPTNPATRYEWNEAFVEKKDSKERPISMVSEGYSRLRILDEPDKNGSTSSSSGDYSVLNIDAIQSPVSVEQGADDEDDDNVTGRDATVNHHYFTLEVLDEQTNQPPEESEGMYFTHQGVLTQQSGSYSRINVNREKNRPVNEASTDRASKGASKPENVYDSLRHNVPRRISQPDQRSDRISPSPKPGFFSYGLSRIDMPRISPPSVPYHKKDQLFKRGQSCHAFSDYNTLGYPDAVGRSLVRSHSPKTPPVSLVRSQSPRNPPVALVRSQSPRTPPVVAPVSHDYDEIEILDDGDTDSDVLTDDDVPITLPSPVSPQTPVFPPVQQQEKKRSLSSEQSAHSNLVQLIITEDGPLLLPRKRSLTADASSLRRFRNHHHKQHDDDVDAALRASSSIGNK